MIPIISSTNQEDDPVVRESSESFSPSNGDLYQTFSLLEKLQSSLSCIQKDLIMSASSRLSQPLLVPQEATPTPRHTQQIQFVKDQIADLKSELSFIKSKVRQSSSAQALCSGPLFLVACLLAISLFAITVIILASLGLAGVLPQIGILMSSPSNMIWSVVSAAIVASICLVSVCSVLFIKQPIK